MGADPGKLTNTDVASTAAPDPTPTGYFGYERISRLKIEEFSSGVPINIGRKSP